MQKAKETKRRRLAEEREAATRREDETFCRRMKLENENKIELIRVQHELTKST